MKLVPKLPKEEEKGSQGWNEFKEGFGFKLHALIDAGIEGLRHL